MKLRARLALSLAVLVVPIAFGVALYVTDARERTVRETVEDALWTRMNESTRARCEEQPSRWPVAGRWPRRQARGGPARPRARWRQQRPGRDAGPFPFSADLRSQHPAAPAFEEDARLAALRALGDSTSARLPDPDGQGILIAVRMPWTDGPCAVLLVRRPVESAGAFRRTAAPALVVSLASVFLVLLVAGPVVRRIRRLTHAVWGGEPIPAPLTRGGDEIAELSRAFEDRREKLQGRIAQVEAQDEALRRFVANTAHDVMTPVTVLQGHLASIDEAVKAKEGVDPARLRDAMEEAHYLSALLRNLNVAAKLEASAVDGAPLAQHPVQLGELVERIIARYQPYARQREVSLHHAIPEAPPTVQGDVTLLEQAIGNLVQNAIRYNERGGNVAVVLEGEGERFSLSVLDDGPGVDEDDLARITERGYRGARARMRRPGGLGLGLALVRDVAERHGFELAFERPEEGGLRVRFGSADPLR